jgi:hypothetical protein
LVTFVNAAEHWEVCRLPLLLLLVFLGQSVIYGLGDAMFKVLYFARRSTV